MKTMRSVLAMALVTAPWLSAQGPEYEPNEGMYDSCRELNGPNPMFVLPANIPSKTGEFTCYADFDGAKGGWIKVYLINRATGSKSIGVTNGDPGFKAHRELADGRWERVQPAGSWVMCADSFSTVTVHPGMFVTFMAKFRAPGDPPERIRYQLPGDENLVSNVGLGSWDAKERDAAQLDGKSPVELPCWLRPRDRRMVVVGGGDPLSRGWIEAETAYLDLLLNYREFRAPRLWCERLLTESDRYPDAWREDVRQRISVLLNRPALAAKDGAEFAARCLDILEGRGERPREKFADLSDQSGMLWSALGSLPSLDKSTDGLPWERIFKLLEARIPRATPPEVDGMCRVMANERQVHENVQCGFLLEQMKCNHAEFSAQCVKLLLHRNLKSELTEAAAKLDEGGRFAVAKTLVSANSFESLSLGYGPINDYVHRRAGENPGRALDAIYEGSGYKTDIYMEPGLGLALRPYMERTVSIGLDGPVAINSFQDRDRVLRVLRIGFRDQVPILRKLLASEAYYDQTRTVSGSNGNSTNKTVRIRFLADEARRMLGKAGVNP